MRSIPYQSQICCKVASLRDHHGQFIRRIKLILRGHMPAVRHRWAELISLVAVDGRLAGPDFYGLTDLASPHIVLTGYHFDIAHFDGMFMFSHSCSWRLLFWVVFHPCLQCAGSFTDILDRAFWTLDFIDDTTLFVIRCLVFGVDQDGAQGVERLVVSPDSMFF